jgi:hypothetical protein
MLMHREVTGADRLFDGRHGLVSNQVDTKTKTPTEAMGNGLIIYQLSTTM